MIINFTTQSLGNLVLRHGKNASRFRTQNFESLYGSSIVIRKVVTQTLRFVDSLTWFPIEGLKKGGTGALKTKFFAKLAIKLPK